MVFQEEDGQKHNLQNVKGVGFSFPSDFFDWKEARIVDH